MFAPLWQQIDLVSRWLVMYPLLRGVAPLGDDGPEHAAPGPWDFFISLPLCFFLFSPFFDRLLSFFSSFILAVSLRKSLGELVHEIHFFYSHTEWNLLTSLSWDRLCFGWGVLSKLITVTIAMVTYLLLRVIWQSTLSTICVVSMFQNMWMGNASTAAGVRTRREGARANRNAIRSCNRELFNRS